MAKKTAKPGASRKRAQPGSKGLSPAECLGADLPELAATIESHGGAVLAAYREPLGGHPTIFAILPIDRVKPTPFQRDLSDSHAKRLTATIGKIGRFLDPIIAVNAGEEYWTPNGRHRLEALVRLGAKSVTALVLPDPEIQYKILALNVEKAHNLREKSLEAIRMARGLAEIDASRRENEFALELEDGSLVTLGIAYEAQPRFAGGAYAPALRASDAFLDEPLDEALSLRQARAERLLAIDARVSEIIVSLRERSFESPYLRNFVVARIRPFRPRGRPAPGADDLLEQMEKAAARFDPAKIRADQISRGAGTADTES